MKCKTCRYNDAGECSYYPPKPALVMAQGMGGPQPTVIGMRPPAQDDAFCSKYEAGAAPPKPDKPVLIK